MAIESKHLFICMTCGHNFRLSDHVLIACPSCGSENIIREPKVGEIQTNLYLTLDKNKDM